MVSLVLARRRCWVDGASCRQHVQRHLNCRNDEHSLLQNGETDLCFSIRAACRCDIHVLSILAIAVSAVAALMLLQVIECWLQATIAGLAKSSV